MADEKVEVADPSELTVRSFGQLMSRLDMRVSHQLFAACFAFGDVATQRKLQSVWLQCQHRCQRPHRHQHGFGRKSWIG
jgi:hypothetical protein